jgi:hypothetical protein
MSTEITNRYVAVAVSHDINPGGEAKDDGTLTSPFVFVKLRVVEGDDIGKELNWRGYLVGGAQPITVDQLRAMGWSDNDITKLTGLGSVKVEVTERMDEYPAGSGKFTPKYSVWPYRGERPTLRDEDKKDFAKKFKALALEKPAIKVTASNAAPTELPPAKERNNTSALPGVPY